MTSNVPSYVGLNRRQAVKLARRERRNYRVIGLRDVVSAEGVPGRLTLWVEKGVVVIAKEE